MIMVFGDDGNQFLL